MGQLGLHGSAWVRLIERLRWPMVWGMMVEKCECKTQVLQKSGLFLPLLIDVFGLVIRVVHRHLFGLSANH